MQEANSKSVLGNFNNATFNYNGIISTFFKKGETFMVTTDNENGKLQSYEVSYTFGVYPLQQYMIKFPKGKVQVLDIAWDSREQKEGGQRWFHIHKDDNVTAGDVLHWTGPNFNWNFMCADCHSTNLQKNYDPKTKTYNTKFDNITLSCTSCHGNGSEHLKWAKNPKSFKGKNRHGLFIDLTQHKWTIDPISGKPSLDGKIDRHEVEMCAQCHSRRAQLDNHYQPGNKFDDHYLLSQLEAPLYFTNGQIKDEVYEYGSFKQSKMYEAGVTCSDCHDVHSLSRTTLNANVCNKCHQESKYATPQHSHHTTNAKGVDCITCHMPSRTYMGVDERNDHSFRLPRPDLSIGTDNPNACNQCHKDKDAQWANDAMVKWYGKVPAGKQNFSHALSALHNSSDTAPQFLYDVLMSNQPNIAKATVSEYLGNYPSQQTYTTTLQMLRNSDSDIRLSALRSLEAFPIQLRAPATFKMLDDTSKTVRTEAARQLSALPKGNLDPISKAKLDRGIEEYKQILLFNADRAESQSGLGALYTNLGEPDKAKEAFDEALRIQPKYVPAIINTAQFYQHSDDAKAKKILEDALTLLPNEAALHYTLGLWYIRHHNNDKAIESLQYAANLEKDNAQYQYVYAVAIADKHPQDSINILKSSLQLHSGDVQSLYGVAYYYSQLGFLNEAKEYQEKADRLSNFTPKH
jgi:tetratricopeptide (TPR) repeat protein